MFMGDSNFEKSEKRILEVKKEEFQVNIYYKNYRKIALKKNESKRKRRKAIEKGRNSQEVYTWAFLGRTLS